jgi:hypothetical protein
MFMEEATGNSDLQLNTYEMEGMKTEMSRKH